MIRTAIVPVRRQGALNTGVAVRNPGLEEITIELTLKDTDGNEVANGKTERMIPARGRIAQFISEFFPAADTSTFSGTICVEALTGDIAVVGLELQVGSIFTTLPVKPVQ